MASSTATASCPTRSANAITPYLGQIIGYAHPADVYNLQVQGSGRLRFADGSEARAQFSAQNGYKLEFRARRSAQFGQPPSPTWSNFRSWLDTSIPAEQKSALNADPSYVFFQEETITDYAAGPKGAANVPLTPMGSIAVDPAYHPYGASSSSLQRRLWRRARSSASSSRRTRAAPSVAAPTAATSSPAQAPKPAPSPNA